MEPRCSVSVSSRTPEGTPNRCPICQRAVVVEPSLLFGDAPCPNCGTLLWFLHVGSDPRFHESAEADSIRTRLRELIARQQGVSEAFRARLLELLARNQGVSAADLLRDPELRKESLSELGADSLDVVELIMKIEEEFG